MILLLGGATGCGEVQLPAPELPDLSELQEQLADLPNVLRDLGLPDLSQIPNLPELADLPIQQSPAGGILFAGPTERSLTVGERIPGTDIVLSAITDEGAEFQIAGLRSVRKAGDSLDFDGDWPEMEGVEYYLRSRIYLLNETSVRLAGVQQLIVNNIQPTVQANVSLDEPTLKFPFTVSAAPSESFPGLTYRFIASADQGAQLSGLPEGDYPYRKVGDSIIWQGALRTDIAVRYDLRLLFYNETGARVGGIVTVALPE